jgi:hypothetical protein
VGSVFQWNEGIAIQGKNTFIQVRAIVPQSIGLVNTKPEPAIQLVWQLGLGGVAELGSDVDHNK